MAMDRGASERQPPTRHASFVTLAAQCDYFFPIMTYKVSHTEPLYLDLGFLFRVWQLFLSFFLSSYAYAAHPKALILLLPYHTVSHQTAGEARADLCILYLGAYAS